ncbi:MAG: bifunctional diaminohydroxyphosphoribosylaminopyrimidine deaminase/5-amino-6-(5-phosphoribosylamino)uracil reductase RibD [Bdellovibrionales bacterium]|nr:bifunctional diaminohydroxyphosphoribosylaminopyrimidine deaminase/5-amino-6-(5-phosphoribosylamino)uracil reductase RibD [Bdellovibrionales bacterium]
MLTPLGAMKLAIDEARKGFGFVAPNPPVGCVILDANGDLLAKGFHRIFGGDHAEIDALKQIQNENDLKGATIYVTLEPCAHEGKTPSCAKRLALLPIKKVVYGLRDPNPLVNGKGAEILRSAGILVEQDEALKTELEELIEIFTFVIENKRPFVALKVATSLDGQMAHVSGESKWITGETAREYSHFLRAQYDAVLIGKETFLRDNPTLDIRHPLFVGKKNSVVVLDTNGEIVEQISRSNLCRHRDATEVFVAISDKLNLSTDAATLLHCKVGRDGKIDIVDLLGQLFSHNVQSIYVEGGAGVLSSFLQSSCAQRFYQFIAPQIIGAKSGINYSKNVSIAELPNRRELRNPKTIGMGRDILITGRLD